MRFWKRVWIGCIVAEFAVLAILAGIGMWAVDEWWNKDQISPSLGIEIPMGEFNFDTKEPNLLPKIPTRVDISNYREV